MTAPVLEPTLAAAIISDAEAIEHALHAGALTALGLQSDAVVVAEIAWSMREANRLHTTVAALAAADYDDQPAVWALRYLPCLWRACQLHGAEYLYPTLTGAGRPGLSDADRLAEALIAETMGEGEDGA